MSISVEPSCISYQIEEDKEADEKKEKVKLMLVNDEFIQLTMLEYHMKRAFSSADVTTFMGINGAEALQEVKQNLQAILRY